MMKKLLIAAVLLMAVHSLIAQETKVPEAVKTKFTTQFPDVTNVKWDKEDGNWEASFHHNNADMSATYDATGNWLETETDIRISDLPKPVTDYVSTNFPNKKIKEASIITKPDGRKWYEAEIDGKDHLFDENGKPAQ